MAAGPDALQQEEADEIRGTDVGSDAAVAPEDSEVWQRRWVAGHHVRFLLEVYAATAITEALHRVSAGDP